MKKVFLLLLLGLLGNVLSHAQYLYGLDPTFANNGIYIGDTGGVKNLVVQQDGKIVITDGERKYSQRSVAMRFNSDGSIDSSFADNGRFFSPVVNWFGYAQINTLLLQPDGKIVLGGAMDTGVTGDDFFLIRLHPNGRIDSSFGGGGCVVTDIDGSEEIISIALQSDGKIVTAGGGQGYIAVARYYTNGTIDSSFGSNGRVIPDNQAWGIHNPTVNDIAITSNDRIILGLGAAVVALNAYTFTAIRLLADGSLDTSFNHTGVAFSNVISGWLVYCKAMSLQPDGKVLLAGYSDSLAVLRFDTSGQLDMSFGGNGLVKLDPAGKVRDMLLQPDGKILLATDPDGAPYPDTCYAIYRILPDGMIDAGFGKNGKILTKTPNNSNMIGCITLQPDGKIIAGGGYMPNWMFPPRIMLARYTPDATESVGMINTESTISLYPNPAADYIYIDHSQTQTIRQLSLYSLDGKLLLTQIYPHTHRLSTEGLADGIYFLKLSLTDHQQVTKKIIIQKQ